MAGRNPTKACIPPGGTVYNDGLLFFSFNNTGNVFMQFRIPVIANQVLPAFYSKNNLDIDLGKCSWHGK